MSQERELLQEVLNQGYFSKDTVMADIFNRITKLLAQPEPDNTRYLLDQVSRLTAENAMLKEKWSSPKPEDFAPRQELDEFKKNYMIGYNAAVRDLKKKVDSVFNLVM